MSKFENEWLVWSVFWWWIAWTEWSKSFESIFCQFWIREFESIGVKFQRNDSLNRFGLSVLLLFTSSSMFIWHRQYYYWLSSLVLLHLTEINEYEKSMFTNKINISIQKITPNTSLWTYSGEVTGLQLTSRNTGLKWRAAAQNRVFSRHVNHTECKQCHWTVQNSSMGLVKKQSSSLCRDKKKKEELLGHQSTTKEAVVRTFITYYRARQ